MNALEQQIENLIKDAEICAQFLEEKPGLCGHQQVIDLYRAIARLAHIVRHAESLRSMPAHP